MKNKRAIVYLVVSVLIIAALGITFSLLSKTHTSKLVSKSIASSDSESITTQADWQQGTYSSDSLNISESGEISLKNTGGPIDIKAIYDANNDSISVTKGTGKGNVVDNDFGTAWEYTSSAPFETETLTFDLGADHELTSVAVQYTEGSGDVSYSTNGTDYTVLGDHGLPVGDWGSGMSRTRSGKSGGGSFTARYLKFPKMVEIYPPSAPWGIYEIQVVGALSSATHTSDATQINGGDNFWGWETFTSTYSSDPPNTDVKFRFRTSTNHTGWTDWSAYQTPGTGAPLNISSLVTSRDEGSGDDNSKDAANFTYYKYLQVETTLTSTDGAHTPTVSDYSLGYHTNTKPNKPVAGTAVIGN